MLAKIESRKAGYDEAILLDDKGIVCEGTGENVFVVSDGVIATPPHSASILDGINRSSVMQIARDLGYELVERDIARAELALADEVFLTGTAAELTPLREIDDIEIGPPGEITREIQRVFDDALHGRDAALRDEWLDRGAAYRRRRERRRTLALEGAQPILRHHPARRHAGGGHVALGRREAARRARARRPRRRT